MKKILVLYTGGTIGMQKNNDGSLIPVDFNQLLSNIPELKNANIQLHFMSLPEVIDSSNMEIKNWQQIASILYDHYAKMDGFVVLHGTDTMAYTASAISFMLDGINKAIIFTGSQIPIGARRTDAKENLMSAIEIAASGKVAEIGIFFEDQLFRANRTVKINSEHFEAFASPNYPALAKVGVNIQYNTNALRKPDKSPLKYTEQLFDDIVILKIFPGITKNIVKAILSSAQVIVLETYGSGNAPNFPWFITLLEEAISQKKWIVNCSQCLMGRVEQGKYETSTMLEKIGVISAKDMTTEACVTKLMHILGQKGNEELQLKLFDTCLQGELTA